MENLQPLLPYEFGWFLSDRLGLPTETEIDEDLNIHDNQLMAYLLDPDYSREVDYEECRVWVQEELGRAQVAAVVRGMFLLIQNYRYLQQSVFGRDPYPFDGDVA